VEGLLDRLAGLPPAGIYLVVGLLAALENIFPPVPADVTVALGGFLAARGAVSAWGIYVVTVIANVAGAAGVFYLSRHFGPRFLNSRFGRRLVSDKAQARIGRLYEKYHLLGIFVSRLLPVYRTIVPPFAAAIGLSSRRTLPPVFAATAVYYGLLTAVSYSLGQNWDTVRAIVGRIGLVLGLAAVALTALVVWLWRRHHAHDNV
jgi:membrane protein DedA with SNARE-associated domain